METYRKQFFLKSKKMTKKKNTKKLDKEITKALRIEVP